MNLNFRRFYVVNTFKNWMMSCLVQRTDAIIMVLSQKIVIKIMNARNVKLLGKLKIIHSSITKEYLQK